MAYSNSTYTLQRIVNSLRTYPELATVTPAGGSTQEPALSIANDVMQKFFAQGMNWKFNQSCPPGFLTVALQQDYVTNIKDLGWLESCERIDINNSSVPKPNRPMESVKSLSRTSTQMLPFNVSWIPNRLAVMGKWQANTAYPCSYGVASTPASPIQQFVDANGNILFIDGSELGIDINSPGVGNPNLTPIGAPYGVSGSTQPVLPANSAAGTTVVDGTVTWTVADPEACAFRLGGLPPTSGTVWLILPVYQKKPPIFRTLGDGIYPIPDEYVYLFRQGFLAGAYEHAGSKNTILAYQKWQEDLMTALRASDRERDSAAFYPSVSITGDGPGRYGSPVGPAWPFWNW